MPLESTLRDGGRTGFDLIETMRWERQAGFVRLERHLARLQASARELGFAYDPVAVDAALRQESEASASDMLRVRLTLATTGQVASSALPFAPLPANTIWKIRIAKTCLPSSDPLLRHKTTRRAVYDAARAEFSREEADEVILLNERGEVCEGTITSIFIDRGRGPLLTPPLSSGLLAGVLRAEMVESGEAMEAVVTVDDLRRATALFVGNSLRGLVPAQLCEP